ncbi:MAG: hypothetical protein R3Y38_07560 [Rikenellaceae bacterium]
MKILIVSNDFIEGGFLREALYFEGLDVCGVCPLEQVEHYCHEHEVGVIISFCHHSLLNGGWCSEFFERLQLKARPKIFLLSSISDENTVISMYKGKVNQYYMLPMDLKRMVKNLSNEISKI